MPHPGIPARLLINPAPFPPITTLPNLSFRFRFRQMHMEILCKFPLCQQFVTNLRCEMARKAAAGWKFNLPGAVGKSNCINVNLLIQYLS